MASLRETLTALLALQQIDKQIQRAKKSQASLDNGTAAGAAATAARDAFESKRTAFHKVSTDLKDCELKLASLETKLKLYETKLYQGGVTNAKELANIEKEIGALGRQRSDLDGQILELMDGVDKTSCEMEIAEAAAKAADDVRKRVLEQYRADYERLGGEVTDLTKQRMDAQSAVQDPQLLKRYDDMRAKSGGIAIVQVVNHNCGGCNMTLPNAQIKMVRDAEDMQTCENCGRILGP